jgi:hypothetical protein
VLLVFSNVCPIPSAMKELFPARIVNRVTAENKPEMAFLQLILFFGILAVVSLAILSIIVFIILI